MKKLMLVLFTLGLAAQPVSKSILVNPAVTGWTHDKTDPPGSDSVMLRQDPASGGMELLVRFPAGHTFKPHWHESNERIVVIEGQVALRQGEKESHLDAGGYAFLPAREMQYLSCTQKGRCAFYLAWDGNPASRTGPVQ